MFTIKQIDDLHARLGSAHTLADYLRGLAAIGVVRSESFVTDGHSEFFADDGRRVVSPPAHEPLAVAEVSDRDALLEELRRHGEGETSYVEMSGGLAASGVERWVSDTHALTMTYCDRSGTVLLAEHVDGEQGAT